MSVHLANNLYTNNFVKLANDLYVNLSHVENIVIHSWQEGGSTRWGANFNLPATFSCCNGLGGFGDGGGAFETDTFDTEEEITEHVEELLSMTRDEESADDSAGE